MEKVTLRFHEILIVDKIFFVMINITDNFYAFQHLILYILRIINNTFKSLKKKEKKRLQIY